MRLKFLKQSDIKDFRRKLIYWVSQINTIGNALVVDPEAGTMVKVYYFYFLKILELFNIISFCAIYSLFYISHMTETEKFLFSEMSALAPKSGFGGLGGK